MEDSGKEFGDLKSILKGNTSVLFSNQDRWMKGPRSKIKSTS